VLAASRFFAFESCKLYQNPINPNSVSPSPRTFLSPHTHSLICATMESSVGQQKSKPVEFTLASVSQLPLPSSTSSQSGSPSSARFHVDSGVAELRLQHASEPNESKNLDLLRAQVGTLSREVIILLSLPFVADMI